MQNDKFSQTVKILSDNIVGLRLVYCFGSYARGDCNLESDVDIAFLSDSKVTDLQRFDLANQLADVFSRDVDLIDLRLASETLRVEMLKDAKCIFCATTEDLDAYEMRTYSEYVYFNEARKDLLEEFIANNRGR